MYNHLRSVLRNYSGVAILSTFHSDLPHVDPTEVEGFDYRLGGESKIRNTETGFVCEAARSGVYQRWCVRLGTVSLSPFLSVSGNADHLC